MKLVDGKIVLEERNCPNCNGTGRYVYHAPCPNNGKPQRGKPCPICGAKTKEHKYTPQPERACGTCNGSGRVMENNCDTCDDLYSAMEFRIYRQDREASWNESHFGAGCVFSCCDYGTAWKTPEDDPALLARVKRETFVQAIKISREDGTLANHIGIFISRGGYSVRAVFDIDKTVAKIRTEPSETNARAVGGVLAAAGFNGTAYAAGL